MGDVSLAVGRLRLHLWELQGGPCCRSTGVVSTSNCGLQLVGRWAMAMVESGGFQEIGVPPNDWLFYVYIYIYIYMGKSNENG